MGSNMRRAIVIVAILICIELVAWKLPTWLADFVSLEGHRGQVSGIVSLDQLSMIATASWDGSWRLYSNKGQFVRAISSDERGLTSIVADHKNQRVVTSSADGMLRIWGLPRGVEQQAIKAHEASIQAIAMDANDRLIASIGYDGFLRIWELENGTMVSEKQLAKSTGCLAIHPQATWLGYGDAANEVVIWSINLKRDTKRLPGFKSQPSAACISSDGSLLVIGEGNGGLSVWDTASWRRQHHQYAGHTDAINQIIFSNDGATFWTASDDKTIRRWNHTDGTAISVLDRHRGPALCVDESLDGKLLTGGAWKNATIWSRP
jgi:WD40 repeat protein